MDIVGSHTLEVMSTATWYNKWLFEMSTKHLGEKILEIGSGIGNFTEMLAKNHDVTATDINKGYLEILKSNIRNVDSGFGDLEKDKFFFKNKKFDSIIAFNVLEHIGNDKDAIGNAYKLLKKGGKFIVIVPAHMFLFSDFDKSLGHFRRYTIDDFVKKAKSSGFVIKEVKYINWAGAVGWFLFMKILKKQELPSREVGVFNLIGPVLLQIEKFIRPAFGLSVYCVAEKK